MLFAQLLNLYRLTHFLRQKNSVESAPFNKGADSTEQIFCNLVAKKNAFLINAEFG